ncbi:MAG: membrane protein insertase YidC [Clostridia bacterium]|nr:membrane protein insertase YidC [Clostridia bacterium]
MNFWDILATPFAYVMKGCYWLTQNYVLALLLFAFVMQIFMCLVFGIRQQKNMIKQAKLRPYEAIIRKKYAGRTDQATMKKMQEEIMGLYQKEGYSPLGGCLPMIVQLIIIFPLYEVVRRPLEFISGFAQNTCNILASAFGLDFNGTAIQIRTATNLRTHDLATITEKVQAMVGQPYWSETELFTQEHADAAISEVEYLLENNSKFLPDVTMFGADLGVTPFDSFGQWYWFLILIPILNLGFTYLSQFLSKKMTYQPAQEGQQAAGMNSMKIMLYAMPLMSMFFTFTFPAAIGIYWIFRTILNTLQQFILSKAMPYPRYTDEDIKNIEKEMKEAAKGKNKKRREIDVTNSAKDEGDE